MQTAYHKQMNCFQLIKTVLDEAYVQIPGRTDAERDEAIRAECRELSAAYAKLRHEGCVEYKDPARRFAYILKYTTSHANIVYRSIQQSADLQGLFDRDKIAVSCVGGGPGSDFLGILKYCETESKNPEIVCNLLDRDPAWGESWSDVGDKLGTSLKLRTVFNSFDVTDSESYKVFTKHFAADLFTLSFFMSEVYAMRDKASAYFDSLFSNMKRGSVLLYVDNNSPSFYEWFDDFVTRHGLTVLERRSGVAQMPYDEEKSDLGEYAKSGRFESPKLKSDIAWRVVRK